MILTLDFCPLFLKSFLYAFNLLFGTLIFAFGEMPLNAFLPTFFSTVDLTFTVFNTLAPSNAEAPISEMFFPMVTVA